MKPSDHKKVEKHLEFSKIKHIFAAQKHRSATGPGPFLTLNRTI